MDSVPDDRDWRDATYETLYALQETYANSDFAAKDISIADVGETLDSLIENGMAPKQAQWAVLRHGYDRTELTDVLDKSQGAVDYAAHAARETMDKHRRLHHHVQGTGLRKLLVSAEWPTDAELADHHQETTDTTRHQRTENFNGSAVMPRGRYYFYEELDVDTDTTIDNEGTGRDRPQGYTPIDVREADSLTLKQQGRRQRKQYTLVIELYYLDEEPLRSTSTNETPDHEFFQTHVETFEDAEEVIEWFFPKHREFSIYEEAEFWQEFLRDAGLLEGSLESGRGLPSGHEASRHGLDASHDGYPWPPESRGDLAQSKRDEVSSLDEIYERDLLRVVFLLDGEMRTTKFQAWRLRYASDDEEQVVAALGSSTGSGTAKLRAFDSETCSTDSLGASLMFYPNPNKGFMRDHDSQWCPCWPVRYDNVLGWTDEQLGYDQ